jgi:hypothetical protein
MLEAENHMTATTASSLASRDQEHGGYQIPISQTQFRHPSIFTDLAQWVEQIHIPVQLT